MGSGASSTSANNNEKRVDKTVAEKKKTQSQQTDDEEKKAVLEYYFGIKSGNAREETEMDEEEKKESTAFNFSAFAKKDRARVAIKNTLNAAKNSFSKPIITSRIQVYLCCPEPLRQEEEAVMAALSKMKKIASSAGITIHFINLRSKMPIDEFRMLKTSNFERIAFTAIEKCFRDSPSFNFISIIGGQEQFQYLPEEVYEEDFSVFFAQFSSDEAGEKLRQFYRLDENSLLPTWRLVPENVPKFSHMIENDLMPNIWSLRRHRTQKPERQLKYFALEGEKEAAFRLDLTPLRPESTLFFTRPDPGALGAKYVVQQLRMKNLLQSISKKTSQPPTIFNSPQELSDSISTKLRDIIEIEGKKIKESISVGSQEINETVVHSHICAFSASNSVGNYNFAFQCLQFAVGRVSRHNSSEQSSADATGNAVSDIIHSKKGSLGDRIAAFAQKKLQDKPKNAADIQMMKIRRMIANKGESHSVDQTLLDALDQQAAALAKKKAKEQIEARASGDILADTEIKSTPGHNGDLPSGTSKSTRTERREQRKDQSEVATSEVRSIQSKLGGSAAAARELAKNKKGIFALLGPDGCGKANSLAFTFFFFQTQAQRELPHGVSPLLVYRTCGGTTSSLDTISLIKSVCHEISREIGKEGVVKLTGSDSEAFNQYFLEHLQLATPARPFFIFFEGIHRLGDNFGQINAKWLPKTVPVNVALFVSLAFKNTEDLLDCNTRLRPKANLIHQQLPTKEIGAELLQTFLRYYERKYMPEQVSAILEKLAQNIRVMTIRLVATKERNWTIAMEGAQLSAFIPPEFPVATDDLIFWYLSDLLKGKRYSSDFSRKAIIALALSRYGLTSEELQVIAMHPAHDIVQQCIGNINPDHETEHDRELVDPSALEASCEAILRTRCERIKQIDLQSFQKRPRHWEWYTFLEDMAPFLGECVSTGNRMLNFMNEIVSGVLLSQITSENEFIECHKAIAVILFSIQSKSNTAIRKIRELNLHVIKGKFWELRYHSLCSFEYITQKFEVHCASEVVLETKMAAAIATKVCVPALQDFSRFLQQSEKLLDVAPNSLKSHAQNYRASSREFRILTQIFCKDVQGSDGVWLEYKNAPPDDPCFADITVTDATSVCVNDNGSKVAIGTKEGMVVLYSCTENRIYYQYTAHQLQVNFLLWTRDDVILSGSDDATVRAYSVKDFRRISTFIGHVGPVKMIATSWNLRFLVSIDCKKQLLIFPNVSSNTPMNPKSAFSMEGDPSCVAWSTDSERVFCASSDSYLHCWTMNPPNHTRLEHSAPVVSCMVLGKPGAPADTNLVLTISVDRICRLWEVKTGVEMDHLRPWITKKGAIDLCAVVPGGFTHLIRACGKHLQLWNMQSQSEHPQVTYEKHKNSIETLAISLDGTKAVSASRNQVCIWTVQPYTHGDVEFPASTCVDITRDGRYIAIGQADGNVRVYSVTSGRVVATFWLSNRSIRGIFLSENAEAAFVADAGGSIFLYDIKLSEIQQTYRNRCEATAVRSTQSRELIVASFTDGKLRLYRSQSTSVYKTLEGHKDSVNTCCMSKTDSMVASCSTDRTVRIWTLKPASLLEVVKVSGPEVVVADFDSQDHYLATANAKGVVRLYDIQRRSWTCKFTAHEGCCVGLSFVGAGYLVSSSTRSIKMWDIMATDRGIPPQNTPVTTFSTRHEVTSLCSAVKDEVICASSAVGSYMLLTIQGGRKLEEL